NRGISFDPGEHRHFAETGSRRQLSDLSSGTIGICYIDIQRAGRGNIKDVAAPLALPHDLFAWLIAQQARVSTNLLAVVHHASANDDFQVWPVLQPAGLFFEPSGSEIEFLADFLHRVRSGTDFRPAPTLG